MEARRLHHDLVLGGLKGVDPSLKEAAAIDGANERQIFFRVVFPAMRPINIVVVVITIIESLRAFDIVYVFNRGTNGLELISALVIQNLVGEGQVIGVGSALAVILLVVSLVPIVTYLARTFGKDEAVMTDTTADMPSAADPLAAQPEHHAVARRPATQALRHAPLPDRDGGAVAGPAAVDALHLAAPEGRHRQVRLLQLRSAR